MGVRRFGFRPKRFPLLDQMARRMSVGGRAVCLAWNGVLIAGLAKFADQAPAEYGGNRAERLAVRTALMTWMAVMREVQKTLEAAEGTSDWCCAPGMAAWPGPCPAHGPAAPLQGDVRAAVRGQGRDVYVDGQWHQLGPVREAM